MKTTLFVLILFFQTSLVSAMEKTFFKRTGQVTEYFTIYSEERKFFVDHYVQNGFLYQNRVDHQVFMNENDAQSFLSRFSGLRTDLAEIKNTNFPQTEDETRVLWTANKTWNQDWELKYSRWVKEETGIDFHKKYGIATDCADVAISLRWIFARMNQLPMASTLAGSKRLITNETMLSQWKYLKRAQEWYRDEAFMAALNYILDNTFTHSLIEDSYPVAIRPGILTEGAHHLNLYAEETGHTRVLYNISQEYGGLYLIQSTVPREVRTLWQEYYSDSSGKESFSQGGFLKIRWAEKVQGRWQLKAAQAMPGYSLEQYDPHFADGFSTFAAAVENRMGVSLDSERRAELIKNMLADKLNARVQIVKDGRAFCEKNNCKPGSSGYEAWSTFHRDAVIADLFDLFESACWSSNGGISIWQKFMQKTLDTGDGMISNMSIRQIFRNDSFSSDPRDSIRRRWGQ